MNFSAEERYASRSDSQSRGERERDPRICSRVITTGVIASRHSLRNRETRQRDVGQTRRAGDRSLSRTLLARTPPLDASARVTVTKRRAVSAPRCSTVPLRLSRSPRPISFILHRIFLPLCRGAPASGSTVSARFSRCRIGASRWRWKVGVHVPAEWGCCHEWRGTR